MAWLMPLRQPRLKGAKVDSSPTQRCLTGSNDVMGLPILKHVCEKSGTRAEPRANRFSPAVAPQKPEKEMKISSLILENWHPKTCPCMLGDWYHASHFQSLQVDQTL